MNNGSGTIEMMNQQSVPGDVEENLPRNKKYDAVNTIDSVHEREVHMIEQYYARKPTQIDSCTGIPNVLRRNLYQNRVLKIKKIVGDAESI